MIMIIITIIILNPKPFSLNHSKAHITCIYTWYWYPMIWAYSHWIPLVDLSLMAINLLRLSECSTKGCISWKQKHVGPGSFWDAETSFPWSHLQTKDFASFSSYQLLFLERSSKAYKEWQNCSTHDLAGWTACGSGWLKHLPTEDLGRVAVSNDILHIISLQNPKLASPSSCASRPWSRQNS